MNSTAIRLYVVAAIIVATYGISRLVQAETEPPAVELPDWTFRALPLQLGNWHGEATKLDPKIAAATGADVLVDRLYRDGAGHAIYLHTARFVDAAVGVYHSPLNCYRSHGWRKLSGSDQNVPISGDSNIAVSLTTWENEQSKERVIVIYWYQLGMHVLHDNFDLGVARWEMRSEPQWPGLLKIMLQTTVTESEESKTLILDFTECIAKWLNQPEHRKYLDRWS